MKKMIRASSYSQLERTINRLLSKVVRDVANHIYDTTNFNGDDDPRMDYFVENIVEDDDVQATLGMLKKKLLDAADRQMRRPY